MRAPVWLTIAILSVACGRIGFDPNGGDGGLFDGPTGDGATPIGRWAQVDVAADAACGITKNGELWCWGLGSYGTLGVGTVPVANPPARVGADTDWRQVSIDYANACGVRTDDSLWCWGNNDRGALGIGQGGTGTYDEPVRVGGGYREVATGSQFGCAIKTDGTLWCWGRHDDGRLGDASASDQRVPAVVSGGTPWEHVSAGADTVCATRTDHSLWCWGRGDSGQVGDGDASSKELPVRVGEGTAWSAVAVTSDHACALDESGAAWCWGSNNDNGLGTGAGPGNAALVPVHVAGALAYATIATGDSGTCATTSGGDLWCWGRNEHGQIPGAPTRVDVPVKVDGSAVQVSLGGDSACAIDASAVLRCTGANEYGQAGAPHGEVHAPERADDRTDWKFLWAHNNHACAERSDATLWCWGAGDIGQLGDGGSIDRQLPVAAGSELGALAIDYDVTLALDQSQNLWVWGYDPFDDDFESAPKQELAHIAEVALGEDHICWLGAGDGSGNAPGVLTCAGDNTDGQLGAGSDTENDAGVIVPNTWHHVYAGANATCGTRANGSASDDLYCWGGDGLTGTTQTGNIGAPTAVAIAAARSASMVAIASDSACAILDDHTLWCWGANYYGQLGDGSFEFSQTPVQIGAGTAWASVAAGDQHYCAITTNHALWCWGHADEGQSGAPALSDGIGSPLQVGTETDWGSVACGDHFTCALKTDGTRWCFGQNPRGLLGNGRSWLTAYTAVP